MSNLENYEGTALDTSEFADVQPEDTSEQTEDIVDETVAAETENVVDDSTKETENAEPVRYNIDGVGEFTADEIREMKNGSLRQSDYTRKTQELAKQRDELKDAQELYDYLRTNPHIVNAMYDADNNPNSIVSRASLSVESQMLRDVVYNQKAIETEMKLNDLKQKYGDIDEVALFEKATEMHTEDLEFVYKALSFDNSRIDERDLIEKAKAELRAELESNKGIVSTTISSNSSSQSMQTKIDLSPEEKRVAAAMGMSYAEYAKWK